MKNKDSQRIIARALQAYSDKQNGSNPIPLKDLFIDDKETQDFRRKQKEEFETPIECFDIPMTV